MWTLDELVDRARVALAAEYPGAPNGRVRELPDRRSIRWYTQTGLVDRPLGPQGRVALYGPRHLLQLVALKRRQAGGRTLAQIQAELTGATDAELAAIARVPERLLTPAAADDPAHDDPAHDDAAHDDAAHDDPATLRARFWATPALVPSPPTATAAPEHADDAGGTADTAGGTAAADGVAHAANGPVRAVGGVARAADGPARAVGGVALGGGAILVLPAAPAPADVAAVTAAAGPLLAVLAERGLLTVDDRDPGRP